MFALFWLSAFTLSAAGDPGFELVKTGELPKWTGLWANISNTSGSAKIIAAPDQAYAGKQFLRIDNKSDSKVISVLSTMSPHRLLPGKLYILTVKVRGNGEFSLGFNRLDAHNKWCQWQSGDSSKRIKLDTLQWQSFRHEFTPRAGDVCLIEGVSVFKGTLDFDDVTVMAIEDKVSEAAPQPEVGQPEPSGKKTGAEPIEKDSVNVRFEDFEKWNGLQAIGWTGGVGKVVNSTDDARKFGKYSAFLNGKIVMLCPLTNLRTHQSQKLRVTLYARGKNGELKVRLREGRYGQVDHLMEVLETPTTPEWERYSGELAMPFGTFLDNAAVEIIGKGVVVDNVKLSLSDNGEFIQRHCIPMVKTPPVIDGDVSDWSCYTGSDSGFLNENGGGKKLHAGNAARRQSEYRLCADDKYLYFALLTRRPIRKSITARDGKVWEDDSLEIHLNPDLGNPSPKHCYQFIINGNGAVFDQQRLNGGSSQNYVKWNAEIVTANGFTEDLWTLEGKIPLCQVEIVPGKPFGLNLCLNRQTPFEPLSLSGAAFLDMKWMVDCLISKESPGVSWRSMKNYGNLSINVANPTTDSGRYQVELKFDTEKLDMLHQKELFLTPGGNGNVTFFTPEPVGKFGTVNLSVYQGKNAVFTQTVPFDVMTGRKPQVAEDLELHYLPDQHLLAVNTRKAFSFFDLTANGKKRRFPIQQFIRYGNLSVLKIPFVPCGRITGELLDSAGCQLAFAVENFVARPDLEPEDSAENYRKVVNPFTLIVVKGNTLRCWGREYIFSGNGLPSQIISQGLRALAKPIELKAILEDGSEITGKPGGFKILSAAADRVEFTGDNRFPGFHIQLNGRMEYDGVIFYTAQIMAEREIKLKNLRMDIPFNRLDFMQSFIDYQLRLWMCRSPKPGEYRDDSIPVWTPETELMWTGFRPFSIFYFPVGDGVLFSSRKTPEGVIKDGFLSFLTVGNTDFGMSCFSDSDRGWEHAKNSSIYEIVRKNREETVRINFFAVPTTFSGRRELNFGLVATPIKPIRTGTELSTPTLLGFSTSGFNDLALSGLRLKDRELFDQQCQRLDQQGKYPLFYCCKGFFPQNDPVAKYYRSEWKTCPDYLYSAASYMSCHQYGLDPDNYFAPAACPSPSLINFFSIRLRDIFQNSQNVRGIYWDENWYKPCNNPNHANCARIMTDGRIQGRTWWNEVREIDKRIRHIYADTGRENRFIFAFTNDGIIPHAFTHADYLIYCERETHDIDFIDFWTLPFFEITAAGAWGHNIIVDTMLKGAARNSIRMHRAMLAVVKLFDVQIWKFFCDQPYMMRFTEYERNFGTNAPDSRFVGYWKPAAAQSVGGLPPECKASFFVRPGKGALIYISNVGKQELELSAKLDFSSWDIANFTVSDMESKKSIAVDDGKIRLKLPRHDFRLIEVRKK